MSLVDYRKKRDFSRTPEPRGVTAKRRARRLEFVIQKHAARRLHYDFRLELDGVLKSWAVPKGPSLVAGERRMAVEVEDHPLEYGNFEGVIPKGEYGGGSVLLWDRGTWHPLGDPQQGLRAGKLDFELSGEKLRGRWHLVRTRSNGSGGKRGKPSWLLIKGRDAAARPSGSITDELPLSVATERSIEDVARDADRVWSSRQKTKPRSPYAKIEPLPIEGVKPGKLPQRIEPQLATLVSDAPHGDDWLHELKLDGYRLLCRIEQRGKKREVRLSTRAGNDWTERFPGVAAAVRALPVKSALIDGEAVVLDADGKSSFQALQRALGEPGDGSAEISYFGFDLVHLDGQDLSGVPLESRKRLLRELLVSASDDGVLRYSDHVRGNGTEFFAAACRSGVEGVVSKKRTAPYRGGRSKAWLKIKCSKRQELVIAGFTDPSGSRIGIGALLLGVHDANGELRYAGKVGTGFDGATLRQLLERLTPLEQETSPLCNAPRMRGVHWVEPKLLAEVSFAEWTDDGRVRHASFQGLREDKPAREVQVERPTSTGNVFAGVRLSNPERVYYPDVGVTKRELAAYYELMAERVLPGLKNRPLTLLRCPQGISGHCFYQKHAGEGLPEAVKQIDVNPGDEPYTMVTDLRSLVSLVQLGVLEFHVWGSRYDKLERPDIIVFDLDPDPSVPWRRVQDAARALRVLLEGIGLCTFLRTTGGKGLHVVVPLVRRSTWDEVKTFSHDVALTLVRTAPDRLTAVMSKSRRRGKIFIDYLRNARDSTAIASYSVRAREGAPVALPIFWEELDELGEPPRTNVRQAPERLDLDDPWASFEEARRPLKSAAQRLAELGA